MEITLESITKKLGFDPRKPPDPTAHLGPGEIDDSIPSIWVPLNPREHAFVFELLTGKKVPEELIRGT